MSYNKLKNENVLALWVSREWTGLFVDNTWIWTVPRRVCDASSHSFKKTPMEWKGEEQTLVFIVLKQSAIVKTTCSENIITFQSS